MSSIRWDEAHGDPARRDCSRARLEEQLDDAESERDDYKRQADEAKRRVEEIEEILGDVLEAIEVSDGEMLTEVLEKAKEALS